jgi:hypothetical protein
MGLGWCLGVGYPQVSGWPWRSPRVGGIPGMSRPIRWSGPRAPAPCRTGGVCPVTWTLRRARDTSHAPAHQAAALELSLPLQGRPCGRPPAAAVLGRQDTAALPPVRAASVSEPVDWEGEPQETPAPPGGSLRLAFRPNAFGRKADPYYSAGWQAFEPIATLM